MILYCIAKQKWNHHQRQTSFIVTVTILIVTVTIKIPGSFAARLFWGMGREKTKERIAAEDFFVQYMWDAKKIAEHLDLQENTVGAWRKKYEWDKKREQFIGDPLKLKQLIAKEMLNRAEGQTANIDADGLYKLYKIVEGLSERINPGIVASVMKLYDEFLLTKDQELAVKNLPYNKQFLLHIINNYG